MKDKSITKNLIPGILPDDLTAEIFGERRTRKVFFIQNGKTKGYAQISATLKAQIYEQLITDKNAVEDLKHLPISKAIEEYAFCCYGELDTNPDIEINGKLGPVENFSCGTDCKCFKWDSKKIKIEGNLITAREYQILKYFASDYADKQIADLLNLSTSTIDSHKMNLFEKFGVHSKTGLISKAITHKILHL